MKAHETQLRIAAERALKACAVIVMPPTASPDGSSAVAVFSPPQEPSDHATLRWASQPEVDEARGALFALAQALEAK